MATCDLAKNKIHARVSNIKLSRQVGGERLMTLELGLVSKIGYPGLLLTPATQRLSDLSLYLMRAAWVFTCKYPEFNFSSIDIRNKYTGELECKPERISPGLVLSVGAFTGGNLCCYQSEGLLGEMEVLDTANKIALVNLAWPNVVQPSRSCQNRSNCLLFRLLLRCELCINV